MRATPQLLIILELPDRALVFMRDAVWQSLLSVTVVFATPGIPGKYATWLTVRALFHVVLNTYYVYIVSQYN